MKKIEGTISDFRKKSSAQLQISTHGFEWSPPSGGWLRKRRKVDIRLRSHSIKTKTEINYFCREATIFLDKKYNMYHLFWPKQNFVLRQCSENAPNALQRHNQWCENTSVYALQELMMFTGTMFSRIHYSAKLYHHVSEIPIHSSSFRDHDGAKFTITMNVLICDVIVANMSNSSSSPVESALG